DRKQNYRSAAVCGGPNVTVREKPTALPAKLSLVMPRYGSSENVAIMVEAGLSRYGPSVRKSGTPYTVVFMKACALGLTSMTRIHGSLKRSAARITLGPLAGATDRRSSLRLTAIVVSGSAAGAACGVSVSVGSARATAIGVGCAAEARAVIGLLSLRPGSGHGGAAGRAIGRRRVAGGAVRATCGGGSGP